jgi:ATP-binding cassette subfamily B protein
VGQLVELVRLLVGRLVELEQQLQRLRRRGRELRRRRRELELVAGAPAHRMRHARRLLGFVRPYRAKAALALVMLASLVVMDLALPRLIQRIIDEGIVKNDRAVVVHTALAMLGLSALSTVLAIGNNVYSVRVGEGVARDLREALFLKLQEYSFGNLDRQKTGSLLVRLTSDVGAVKGLTQISLRIGTRAPLLMIGSLVLMVTTSSALALALLPLLVVTALLIVFFIVRMEPRFQRVQQRLDAVNTVLQENISGARLVKALVRADHEGARFEVANEAMTAESIRLMRFMASMMPALTMCVNLGVVVVIGVGGKRAIHGELTLGQLVAFTNYLLTTMTPLVMMTMLSNMWAAGLTSLRRMDEIFDSVPEVVDAPDAVPLPASARPEVVFDDVSFAYAGDRSEAVLREVALSAAPGKTIAILGATGAGKSTLVHLIPRFYDATTGSVRAFGRDVRAVTQGSLISKIGLVPQESLLFSGTVRDNIRYGRPDASDDLVVAAARAAQAHDFISRLPDGYDSRVEQRGANFSGGQKQRLAIARALLVDPAILILDDSTSAVDVETETEIQRALKEGAPERTTFVVAQRISTVLDADTILVLDEGRIVAQGTHRELLSSSAVYREIYDSQLGAGSTAE